MKNENERLLYELLNEAYPGRWKQDIQFIEERKYRGDAVNVKDKILVEIEGGLWIMGRHNRPVGMQEDMEKYNLATVHGWKVLRYTPETLRKTPYKLIRDIRMLLGDENQQTLNLDGLQQKTLSEQAQVKLS